MNSCTRTPSLVPAIACLAGLLVAPVVPAADSAHATRSLAVPYSYQELATVGSASNLYRRIEAAARFVCGAEGQRMDERSDFKHCYRHAVDGAVTEVNNPLLTAVHRQQLGELPETAMLSR
jgi:UrcA family protein